ncbi:MAG TPA: sugar-binding domain-containing protein [Thermomicrobiales bacterium]|nr:sugar-binding domain-containing protein [Thermomicrobiales bacterium]
MADQNNALIATVARMYYLDRLGQTEIANICGVSRSTVSRFLTTARDRGIVRISVDDVDPRNRDLERQLINRFGLRHAIVVRDLGGPPASVRRAVGYFAAQDLADVIGRQRMVGVAGGRTLAELVHHIEPRPFGVGPTFVQMMGAIGSSPSRIDASEQARSLARRFNGTFRTLNTPAYAQSHRARELFLSHQEIQAVWAMFPAVDLALVGVGTLEESAFFERGVLDDASAERIRQSGAVGEICGRFFDERGEECATEFSDRVISIGLDVLRECPDVTAILSGTARSHAMKAAVRGNILKSVVIDQAGAKTLLGTP